MEDATSRVIEWSVGVLTLCVIAVLLTLAHFVGSSLLQWSAR
jgi:hypothetical protein